MTAARKKAAETMADIDVVIEVLDARVPEAGSNPMIHELRAHRQRACLKVLNKSDLADPAATAAWIAYFERQPGVKAVAISAKKPADVAKLPGLAQKLAPHRNDVFKPLRLMIMGIPNVGKSTLMNALVKKKIAKVGDEPAVTKSQQRINLTPRLTLIDTPGLMWPKIEHDADGYMLAACHAIGKNAVIDEAVAEFLAGILLVRYPQALVNRYKLKLDGLDSPRLDPVGVVEAVAKKRGCLRQGRGGELDLEKAANILLTDFRSGALGRISLETPGTRAAMLEASRASLRGTQPNQENPEQG
jgi:ribosome biogenesis GTPase A